jgi:hypothetical protein
MAFRKIRRKSEFSIHMVDYRCSHREFYWNPNSQHTWTPSVAAWPPRRLCYHPAVFFRHLRLTALSFPHEKIRRAFQTRYFSCLFFNFFLIAFKSVIFCNLHNHRRHDLKSLNSYLISVLQANPHQLEELLDKRLFFLAVLVAYTRKTFEN